MQLFGFGLRRVVHDAMEAEIEQKHHQRRRRYQQHIFLFSGDYELVWLRVRNPKPQYAKVTT